jgi:hypothetical protein
MGNLVSSGCAPSVDPLFGGHLNLLLWPQGRAACRISSLRPRFVFLHPAMRFEDLVLPDPKLHAIDRSLPCQRYDLYHSTV